MDLAPFLEDERHLVQIEVEAYYSGGDSFADTSTHAISPLLADVVTPQSFFAENASGVLNAGFMV
jgi:hypothetical protein